MKKREKQQKEPKKSKITTKEPLEDTPVDAALDTHEPKNPEKKPKNLKKSLFFIYLAVFFAACASGVSLYFFWYLPAHPFDALVLDSILSASDSSETPAPTSVLTGLPLKSGQNQNDPIFCTQIPNGLDGARPQAGLTEAGVVFEAIAETGITRFAAIFQNPETSVIGPIRSLRTYYLEWDTPFDCTIVHAGGSGDALENLRIGGYKDLTENYAYMWRGAPTGRLWNNLFTSSDYYRAWTLDTGYATSEAKGFSRLTEEEAEVRRITSLAENPLQIDTPTSSSVNTLTPRVTYAHFDLNNALPPYFNPVFTYNSEKNTYDRSFENGDIHTTIVCPPGLGEVTPELDCATETQISPSVVIAMIVQESLRTDDYYHEDIVTTGSGKAYIFQNGGVIEGTWNKPDKYTQISFTDASGAPVSLVPGQTWLTAVPSYGAVDYH